MTEQARLGTISSGVDNEPACEAVIPAAQKASYSFSVLFLCIWGPTSHWRLLDCATSEHKKCWSVGGLFWPCTDSNPPLLQLLLLLRLCMLSVLVLACVCVCFCVFVKLSCFTWPAMAVIGGRWRLLESCTCCGCMWMAHPDQADSLQG